LGGSLPKALLSWSGGKDSSLALYELQIKHEFQVAALLTTFINDFDRVSMHGVRKALLEKQAGALGLPLEDVWISKGASNTEYEREMGASIREYLRRGVRHVAFGDLFLQDIRKYREAFLGRLGVGCIFPIWGRDTRALANFFLDSGFRAIVCTIDLRRLGKEYCGREFDRSFLSEIPEPVDPCGENGEFHTFVYDGPVFNRRIGVVVGEITERDGFYFADLRPE